MTLRSRIFPVLLLRGEGLVKTIRFSDAKYVGDPINAVKIYNEKEVDELTLFDIGATVDNTEPNFELLQKIAAESRMPLCYGGGVKDAETAARLVSLGFEKVSISNGAVENPQLITDVSKRIGQQSTVVTLDVRKEGLLSKYRIYTKNGKTRQKPELFNFLKTIENNGAGEIVINSIERDGSMKGYDLPLASAARKSITLPLSIVGGAGSVSDIGTLIENFGPIGAGAGSLFVFKGKYRAVLLSYARP